MYQLGRILTMYHVRYMHNIALSSFKEFDRLNTFKLIIISQLPSVVTLFLVLYHIIFTTEIYQHVNLCQHPNTEIEQKSVSEHIIVNGILLLL